MHRNNGILEDTYRNPDLGDYFILFLFRQDYTHRCFANFSIFANFPSQLFGEA